MKLHPPVHLFLSGSSLDLGHPNRFGGCHSNATREGLLNKCLGDPNLLWLLYLVLLDCLTRTLVVSTKSLMDHHLTSFLIAPSVLLPSIHQLGIVYLELLIFLQKVSLKSRHIFTRRRTRHGKQVLA